MSTEVEEEKGESLRYVIWFVKGSRRESVHAFKVAVVFSQFGTGYLICKGILTEREMQARVCF